MNFNAILSIVFSSSCAYLGQALRIYLEEILSMSSCIKGKLCSRHRRCLAGMFRKMGMWYFTRGVQSEWSCQILLPVLYRVIEMLRAWITALFPSVCVCKCSDKWHIRTKPLFGLVITNQKHGGNNFLSTCSML